MSEGEAVFELASLHWKKRRFEAGLQQALQKQQDLGTGADTNDLLGDIARNAAKSQAEAAQHVCEDLGNKRSESVSPMKPNVDSKVVEFEKLTVSVKEFNLVFEDLVSSLRRIEEQKLDQIEQAYRPHIMEKELKIQAEVDRRIEKVLKRLVIINEYKKQYRPKSVNAIQIEATKLPPKSSDESEEI